MITTPSLCRPASVSIGGITFRFKERTEHPQPVQVIRRTTGLPLINFRLTHHGNAREALLRRVALFKERRLHSREHSKKFLLDMPLKEFAEAAEGLAIYHYGQSNGRTTINYTINRFLELGYEYVGDVLYTTIEEFIAEYEARFHFSELTHSYFQRFKVLLKKIGVTEESDRHGNPKWLRPKHSNGTVSKKDLQSRARLFLAEQYLAVDLDPKKAFVDKSLSYRTYKRQQMLQKLLLKSLLLDSEKAQLLLLRALVDLTETSRKDISDYTGFSTNQIYQMMSTGVFVMLRMGTGRVDALEDIRYHKLAEILGLDHTDEFLLTVAKAQAYKTPA